MSKNTSFTGFTIPTIVGMMVLGIPFSVTQAQMSTQPEQKEIVQVSDPAGDSADFGMCSPVHLLVDYVSHLMGLESVQQQQLTNEDRQIDSSGTDTTVTTIRGHHIFYNNSGFDGHNSLIDVSPNGGNDYDHDDAIDPSKQPLLPGAGMATTANYTPYTKGINGIMVDVSGATTGPLLTDFTFTNIGKYGNDSIPVTPSDYAVRPGAGIDGSDRVVFTFENGSLTNSWLQVDCRHRLRPARAGKSLLGQCSR